MTPTHSADEFQRLNHSELIGMAKSMGIRDRDDLHEITQNFYLKLPALLSSYDPTRSAFSTYVWHCLNNVVATYKASEQRTATSLEFKDDCLFFSQPVYFETTLARINDFAEHCRKHGRLATARILTELDYRINDSTLAGTAVWSATWSSYVHRFLFTERYDSTLFPY